MNCWEYKQCGREPGGNKVKDLGICPAATEQKLHGINGGTNGGRSCWVIKETLCGNQVQGGFAEKLSKCLGCDFYSTVRDEEGSDFVISKNILAKLNC